MENKKTNFIKTCLILIVIGLILMMLGVALGAKSGWYVYKDGIRIEDREITVIKENDLGSFTNINIDCDFSDVKIIEGDTYAIDIRTSDKIEWSIENDILKISSSSEQSPRLFSMDLGFFNRNFENEYIKVYVPKEIALGSLNIDLSSGNLDIRNVSVDKVLTNCAFGNVDINNLISKNITLSCNSGRLNGNNISSELIELNNDFGDIDFKHVTTKTFNIKSNAGNIDLNNCTSENTTIENDFGDIDTNNLTSTITTVNLEAGHATIYGNFLGNTKIKSSFGDIDFYSDQIESYYKYNASTSFGNIKVNNQKVSNPAFSNNSVSEVLLDISNESGNIDLRFNK